MFSVYASMSGKYNRLVVGIDEVRCDRSCPCRDPVSISLAAAGCVLSKTDYLVLTLRRCGKECARRTGILHGARRDKVPSLTIVLRRRHGESMRSSRPELCGTDTASCPANSKQDLVEAKRDGRETQAKGFKTQSEWPESSQRPIDIREY